VSLPDLSRTIARGATLGASWVQTAHRYWPAAATILVAIVVRSLSWLNCDVSWLLTLGEQVLSGARPYIDFTEPNPPASILIYMPAILIGRIFGFEPELAVTLLIFAGVVLSLWMCGRILSGNDLVRPHDRPIFLALGCVLLLILPGDAFAQREHIALLAIMPMLCVYAMRANNTSVGMVLAALAGIGGGIAIAIKPYFALALIVPLTYVAWRLRKREKRLMPLIFSLEHMGVVTVLVIYACAIVTLFSNYTRVMLPIVLAVYAPSRAWIFLILGGTSIALIAMSTIVARAVGATEFRDPVIRIFTLAVLGFAIAILAQGKGWQYHSYPAMTLSMLVLGALLAKNLNKRTIDSESGISLPKDIAFGAVLFVGIYAIESFWFLPDPSRVRLVHEVSRLVPAHPKVVSINGGPEIAFPLTRKLGGTPIWPVPFQWVSAGADRLLESDALDPETRSRIEHYAWADRQELAQSIRTQRPDVILIGDGPDERWALGHAEIAAAIRDYRPIETVDGVEIWRPRNTRRTGSP
jgi:hypothetical protein